MKQIKHGGLGPWQFSNKKTGGKMKSGSASQYRRIDKPSAPKAVIIALEYYIKNQEIK